MEDQLTLTLMLLASGDSPKKLAERTNLKEPLVRRTVVGVIEHITIPLKEEFVWFRRQNDSMPGYFENFPRVVAVMDASVVGVPRPDDNDKARRLYSGKHKKHCVKVQTIHDVNGRLMHLSKVVHGSIHDFALFKDTNVHVEFKRSFGNNAGILVDKGYTGIKNYIPQSVVPKKKPKNGSLTYEESERNKQIGKARIIIENFYGRAKNYFKVAFFDSNQIFSGVAQHRGTHRSGRRDHHSLSCSHEHFIDCKSTPKTWLRASWPER